MPKAHKGPTKAELLAQAKAVGVAIETDDNKADLERKLAEASPAPVDPLPQTPRQGPLGEIERKTEAELIAEAAVAEGSSKK